MNTYNNLLEKRQIRVFVSSTFKDLHRERNFLMRRTFPKLQEEALKHGISITEMDLRWGITEDESKLGKVLQICLEEVDNSVPFFVGILGKRYGWIPTLNDINNQIIENAPQVKKYIENHISITEMEFLYGALEREENMNAIFFVTKDEPTIKDKSDEKLHKLREKVINNGQYPVFYYDSPEDISTQVETYFIKFFEKHFPIEARNAVDTELYSQYLHAKHLTANFIESVDYSQYINDWLASDDTTLLITGNSGIGKSTILAKWICENINQQSNNYIVIPQFIGYGGNHCSGEYVKNFIVETLSNFLPSTCHIDKRVSLEDQLLYVIKKLPVDFRCVIIIDGVNQISEGEKDAFLDWVLKSKNSNIKIIISSIPNDLNTNYLIANNVNRLTIEKLNDKEKRQFVVRYLAQKGKKLDDTLLKPIINSEIFDNTLALKILLDTITLFSLHETIVSDIGKYTNCKSVNNFYQTILDAYDNEFGYTLMRDIFSYVYVSKRGVYIDEIISLGNITPLIWAQIYRILKINLSEEKGRIKFIHHNFADAIYAHYLNKDITNVIFFKKKIVAFLEKKENLRTWNELPYHYDELGAYDALYKYLTQLDVASYFLEHNGTSFASFWRKLSKHNSAYSITNYINLDNKNDETATDFFMRLGILTRDLLKDLTCAEIIFKYNLELSQKANENFESVLEDISKNIEGLEVISTPESLKYTGSFCNLGDIKYDAGLFEEALVYYHKAVGFLSDARSFYDLPKIKKEICNISFFNNDDKEFYRVAYALHRLGRTYDDLAYKEIACLMYQEAANYLKLRNKEETDLLCEIYHNWAVSLSKENPQKSIDLLESSIALANKLKGLQHTRIPESLCCMGAIYNDELNKKEEALRCYDSAIELEEKLRGKGSIVLGNLYYNRSCAQPSKEDAINDLQESVEIFLELGECEKAAKTYRVIGHTYYNNQEYISAFYYYLISYNFSFLYCGNNAECTMLIEQDVLECLQIALKEKKLSYDAIFYLSVFFNNTNQKILCRNEWNDLFGISILPLMKEISQYTDRSNEIISRNLYLILPYIDSYYERYHDLPFEDDNSIKTILIAIYYNKHFYEDGLDFIKKVEFSADLDKWELYCFYLYLKNELIPLQSDELAESVLKFPVSELLKEYKIEEDLLLPSIFEILNSFIYYSFIPNQKYEFALKTIDVICQIDTENPIYLDSKAEILYRMGRVTDAIELIKKVIMLDSEFYPDGNEFLFDAIVRNM